MTAWICGKCGLEFEIPLFVDDVFPVEIDGIVTTTEVLELLCPCCGSEYIGEVKWK